LYQPHWLLPDAWVFTTKLEFEKYRLGNYNREAKETAYYVDRYDLTSYVHLARAANITLSDWFGTYPHGVPKSILKAIAHEVDEMNKKINQEQERQRQDMKLANQESISTLGSLKPNSAMTRLYG
jgi:hypothetical protein